MSEQRFFIELSYDGTNYCGWQRQPKEPSVQEELETQLSKLFSGAQIPVVGCGRTDTGVHAAFYVAHLQLPAGTDGAQLKHKLNKMLPGDIAVFRVFPVEAELHARFDAKERTYRYYLHQQKSAFLKNSLYFPAELDFDLMNEAAKQLFGTQDFTSLSKLHTDVKTNICTVTKAEWKPDGDQWYFEIAADRFLRNMVRATVGTLLEVGRKKIEPAAIPAILAAKDRSAAKVSVAACGLFLWDVKYE
jgi:tRNA pseudouridine38-40 synthase